MSDAKPVVFVTRNVPEAVEERLARDYRARLNAETGGRARLSSSQAAQVPMRS